jgi:trk system potassium uptake protein TrkH
MLGFLKPVLYILGLFLTGLGLAMLLPGLVDVAKGDSDADVFFISAAITTFIGSMFAITNRGDVSRIEPRQAFVLTTLSWVVLTAFSALPFAFSRLGLSFADAYFEAMSGLTTTGATVIADLHTVPDGILVWRAVLHGIGGLGIVVMAVLILPFLKVGGAQLFRAESSDRSERPFPRFAQLVTAIGGVYTALILLCTAALWLAGMSAFDAIVHGMSAVATGGFSNSDTSIGAFDSLAIDWILVVFMIAGALPLTWHVRLLREGRRGLMSDNQVWVFLALTAAVSLVVAIWLWARTDYSAFRSLTLAAFNVTSIITTTGFVHGDYSSWGTFPVVLFFLLCFVGGCSGSTSGSIKVFRWELFFSGLRRLAISNFQPNRVIPLFYNGQRVTPETIFSVFSFLLLFIVTFAVLSLIAALLGADFVTATSGIAAMMSNSGPGLGEIIGPAGTYKPLSDPLKWLFSLAMLLGRLELLTVLVLLFPDFWRT